jgi:hypothetical protein
VYCVQGPACASACLLCLWAQTLLLLLCPISVSSFSLVFPSFVLKPPPSSPSLVSRLFAGGQHNKAQVINSILATPPGFVRAIAPPPKKVSNHHHQRRQIAPPPTCDPHHVERPPRKDITFRDSIDRTPTTTAYQSTTTSCPISLLA